MVQLWAVAGRMSFELLRGWMPTDAPFAQIVGGRSAAPVQAQSIFLGRFGFAVSRFACHESQNAIE